MAKEVTIVIAGKVATGKTTIAEIVQKALNEHGIKNRLFDRGGVVPQETFEGRCKGVSEKVNVVIKTVQVSRDLTPE